MDHDNRWAIVGVIRGSSTGGLFSVPFSSAIGVCVGHMTLEPSPAPNPWNFATESVTKIDHGLMQWHGRDSCPQFELVALTVTLMARVAAGRYVHREGAFTP